jgi:hypothetical protein
VRSKDPGKKAWQFEKGEKKDEKGKRNTWGNTWGRRIPAKYSGSLRRGKRRTTDQGKR